MNAYLSLAFAAAAALASSVAVATPSLQFVANNDSSVTLQIDIDDAGSVATEIAVEFFVAPDIELTSATIVDPVFDTPNPGNNPFTFSTTNGIWLGLPDQLFVSYGSSVLSPGVYDFLKIGYVGEGTITATGNVAQLGLNNPGLTASIFVPEPSTALIGIGAIASYAARRRR
ncbi:MAG: PEP-CTERM sorting domain-containing protein [Planctomycetota bacterium]